MYAVCVTFKIKAEFWDTFLPLIQIQAKNSLEKEKDCLRFDVCIDSESNESVFLYEIYTDQTAFSEHLKTTHFLQFDEISKDMFLEKTVQTFDQVFT